jgi:hypothetical protein
MKASHPRKRETEFGEIRGEKRIIRIPSYLMRWAAPAAVLCVMFLAVASGIRGLLAPLTLRSQTIIETPLPTIVQEMRTLATLDTAEFRGEKVVEARDVVNPLPTWLVGDSVLLVAQGVVTAGVDLQSIQPGDVRAQNGTVHVHLPHAQITAVRLDNRSDVYDHHTGLFSRVEPH